MTHRSRFSTALVVWVAACGGTPQAPSVPAPVARVEAAATPVENLETAPAAPLLSIDWSTVPLATDEQVAAVWAQIAPTGDDWEAKLGEVPVAPGRVLGAWFLKQGNVTCARTPAKATDCAPLVLDVDPPKPTADVSDPCLRRMLAMWSIHQLDDADVAGAMDALRTIVVIPPPESELVASAIEAVPESDHDARLELIALAYKAGQRDVANAQLGQLDQAHVLTAATKHHIDGALEILSAQGHRAAFVGAITDEHLAPKARVDAIAELVSADDTLAKDTKAALVKAATSKDCTVAAAAAHALALRGDKRFVPTRPRTSSPAVMMRALCVLASYERLQGNDEASLLVQFVPPKGLEQVSIAYDALAEVDTDGDGDPRTDRTTTLVPRTEVLVPEVDDMIRAFKRCEGTACVSHDRDYRFGLKAIGGQLFLARLEVAERPPCPSQ